MDTARSRGLGGGGCALGKDADFVWVNPASIGGMKPVSVIMGGRGGMFGGITGEGILAVPIENAAVSCGFYYDDAGDVTLYTSGGGERNVSARRDVVGTFGLALEPFPGAAAGGAVKLLNHELGGEISTGSIMLDLGARLQAGEFVSLGAAVQNLGADLKFGDEKVPLPLLVRAGAGLTIASVQVNEEAPAGAVAAVLDVSCDASAGRTDVSAGGEVSVLGTLQVRGGIRLVPADQPRNVSLGAGFVSPGDVEYVRRYVFDYAIDIGKGDFAYAQILGVKAEF